MSLLPLQVELFSRVFTEIGRKHIVYLLLNFVFEMYLFLDSTPKIFLVSSEWPQVLSFFCCISTVLVKFS
jgi:hypothetical protein